MSFPYTSILRQAYAHTAGNFQVWVFGIFLSFASGFVFLILAVIINLPNISFVRERWQSPWIAADLSILLLVFLVSALSKASLIWSAQKLEAREEVPARPALAAGSNFVFTVFGLKLLLTLMFLVMAGIVALPVGYLIMIREIGRAVALSVLGLAIFVPVSILVALAMIYSPVISVLYKISARSALVLAFSLSRTKLKESLIMSALIIGIWLGFMVACGFGIIMIGAPVAFLSLVLAKFGLYWVISAVIVVAVFLVICALIVLAAGVSVFHNFAWTLAVMEMVKTEKHDEPAKTLAPEAEPAA